MTAIWKHDEIYLFVYVEDREKMDEIKQRFPDVKIVAEYRKKKSIIGRQYRVPTKRNQEISKLLGVGISK